MSETNCKYSIVIPTFNRASLLKICLQSLCEQNYKNFKVIICDNGSTDSTQEVVDEFKNKLSIDYYLLEPSGGPGRPRNFGIEKANTEWICLLDSDDWWTSDKLEIINNYTEQYDFIYHPLRITDGKNEQGIRGGYLLSSNWVEFLYKGNPIPCSAVSFRKKMINHVGLHDESPELKFILDFEYWLRFIKNNTRIIFIPRVLGYYYVLPGHNLSTNELRNYESHLFLFEKYKNEISELVQLKRIESALELRKLDAFYKSNTSGYSFKNVALILLNLYGIKNKIHYMALCFLYLIKRI